MKYLHQISLCLSLHATVLVCMQPDIEPKKTLVGIAACSATEGTGSILRLAHRFNPDFIELKTIRRHPHPGHPSPLITPIHISNGQLTPDTMQGPFYSAQSFDRSPTIAVANSIGLPSPSLTESMYNIQKIQELLEKNGHTDTNLILSVYGNTVEDFSYLAYTANKLPISYVCANLSCPNVQSPTPLYKDPRMVAAILSAMKTELPDIPLIAKIGLFKTHELPLMETILCTIAASNAFGVYGINTVPAEIFNKKKEPFFGKNRTTAGISGSPIRSLALLFTEHAREIIDRNGLNLKLFACGGVTSHEHVEEFAQKGADVVMSATGVMFNPTFSFKPNKPKSKL